MSIWGTFSNRGRISMIWFPVKKPYYVLQSTESYDSYENHVALVNFKWQQCPEKPWRLQPRFHQRGPREIRWRPSWNPWTTRPSSVAPRQVKPKNWVRYQKLSKKHGISTCCMISMSYCWREMWLDQFDAYPNFKQLNSDPWIQPIRGEWSPLWLIEFVDLPMRNGGSFQFVMLVYHGFNIPSGYLT